MTSNFAFIWREGVAGVRRGVFHSFVAAAALALAVAVLGFFYYSRLNLQRAAAGLLGQFQFEAFISIALPENQHGELQQKLQSLDPRWKIAYISRAEAAAKFAREFDPSLFDVLKDNPLPASFIITLPANALHPDSAQAISERISRLEGIDDLVYDRELLNLLHSGHRKLADWGLWAGGIAMLLAIGLTYNAVRLKIDHQRDTIRLMSLFGATPGMLRGIYWMQGIFLGAAGGIASAVLLSVLAIWIQARLAAGFNLVQLHAVLPILAGAFLGALGSALAVGRYLKV